MLRRDYKLAIKFKDVSTHTRQAWLLRSSETRTLSGDINELTVQNIFYTTQCNYANYLTIYMKIREYFTK